MISKFARHLKERQIFCTKHGEWEKLADRTVNSHIKHLRHALEIVDKVGTQELREPLITIKRPHLKKILTSQPMRSLLGFLFCLGR